MKPDVKRFVKYVKLSIFSIIFFVMKSIFKNIVVNV